MGRGGEGSIVAQTFDSLAEDRTRRHNFHRLNSCFNHVQLKKNNYVCASCTGCLAITEQAYEVTRLNIIGQNSAETKPLGARFSGPTKLYLVDPFWN